MPIPWYHIQNPGALNVTATGATTARSLAARFADVVNVKDFGAKGDGVTDDTAAIQAAIDAGIATGREVFFPPGSYLVSQELAVHGRFLLRGCPGATLICATTNGNLIVDYDGGDVTGFAIRDLAITTTRDTFTMGGGLIYLDFCNVEGGLIDNCTLTMPNSAQVGILIAAQTGKTIKNVWITRNRITTPAAAIAILHHSEQTQTVSGINISDNVLDCNAEAIGFTDPDHNGLGVTLSGTHKAITVANNDIRGFPYGGIEVAFSASHEAEHTITGNTVIDTGRGIFFDPGAGGSARRISHVTLANNKVRGNRYFQRIENLADSVIANNEFELVDASASSTRVSDFCKFDYLDRCVVTGNTARIEMPDTEEAKATICVQNVTASKFNGNRFRNTGLVSLWLAGTTNGNEFVGNTIDWNPNGTAADALRCDGAGVTGNAFIGTYLPSTLATNYPSQVNGATGNLGFGTATVTAGVASVATFGRLPIIAFPQTGGGTQTPNLDYELIRYQVGDASDFTVANPSNAVDGRLITIVIHNNTANPMGAITWGTKYRWAGGSAPASPAAHTMLVLTFWYETQMYQRTQLDALDAS